MERSKVYCFFCNSMKNIFVMGIVCVLAYVPNVVADVSWTSAIGGTFSDGSNWNTGTAPGTGDKAIFNTAGEYTVTWNKSVTNSAASFGLANGTITLDVGSGNEYYLDNEIHLMSTTGLAHVDLISGLVNLRTHLYLGDSSASSGNKMTIRNTGTELRVRAYDVDIGRSGSNNELLVKDGAKVVPYRSIYSGYGNGTNNLVTISGIGTVLDCITSGGIIAGRDSDYNRFIIEESAKAYCTNNGYMIIGDNADADWNSVTLRSGAEMYLKSYCYVGDAGFHNTLSVSNNALYKSESNLSVGNSSGCSFNNLDVISGGVVLPKLHLYVGGNSGANSNSVLVSGAGSVISNVLYDINIGNYGDYNSMLVTNDGLVSAYRTLYVGTKTGSHNELTAIGTNTLVEVRGLNYSKDNLVVGYDGIGNSFMLDDGATFIATNRLDFQFGENAGSSNNSLVVRGGSVVTNGGNIYVGNAGSYNTMDIDNSLVRCGVYSYAGNYGSHNTLSIYNGGAYDADAHIYIGSSAGANSNSVYVTGEDSRLFNTRYDLDVGKSGAYNLLKISDGAEVEITRDVYVGHNATASNNVLRVENATLLNNTDSSSDFIVAYNSSLEVAGSTNVVQAYDLNVVTDSTLKLELGKSGFNPIYVSNRVTFDSTTKLDVDATEFAKQGGGTVTVLDYKYKTGEIIEENMTLIPEGTIVDQITDSSITLYVANIAGTVIVVQ